MTATVWYIEEDSEIQLWVNTTFPWTLALPWQTYSPTVWIVVDRTA